MVPWRAGEATKEEYPLGYFLDALVSPAKNDWNVLGAGEGPRLEVNVHIWGASPNAYKSAVGCSGC